MIDPLLEFELLKQERDDLRVNFKALTAAYNDIEEQLAAKDAELQSVNKAHVEAVERSLRLEEVLRTIVELSPLYLSIGEKALAEGNLPKRQPGDTEKP